MKFKPGLIIFSRRLVIKRLMGPDRVIGPVLGFQLLIMFLQAEADIFDFVKLDPIGFIGALSVGVQ